MPCAACQKTRPKRNACAHRACTKHFAHPQHTSQCRVQLVSSCQLQSCCRLHCCSRSGLTEFERTHSCVLPCLCILPCLCVTMQRPTRQVRSHPFPSSDAGALPRPKAKLHLAGRPCPGLSTAHAQSLPLPTHSVCDIMPRVSFASGVVDCRSGDGCSRTLEDAERRRLAGIWLGFAKAVACDSNLKESLEIASDAALLRLFLDRAPATLRRHLGGWRLWIGFCASQGWRAGSPSLSQVLDFTVSLVEGTVGAAVGARRCHASVACHSLPSSSS